VGEIKKLMKILQRVVDPHGDTDITALHDRIVDIVRADLLSLKPPERDGNLNPEWNLYLPFKVTRHDNSLVVAEEVANFTDSKKKVVGKVGRTPRGYLFTVSCDKGDTVLAVNIRDAVTYVFENLSLFKKTRKKKLERPCPDD
jgi:hypothetical protein